MTFKRTSGGDNSGSCDKKTGTIGFTESFWSNVAIGKKTDCWEWHGKRSPQGYGSFSPGKSAWPGTDRAHRIALMLDAGGPPLMPDLFACHTCDNPPCCNPAHLFWGTAGDNAADMMSKLRGTIGKKARHNTLEERQVLLIVQFLERHPPRRGQGKKWRGEELCGSARFLARWFGVSKDTVADIGRGRWWSWLTDKTHEVTKPQFARGTT